MRISPFIAALTLPLLLGSFQIAAVAQQQTNSMAQPSKVTPAQVKDAVKQALMSVGLTRQQKLEIRKMVQSYEQQTTNADDATKQAAQKTLLENIYGKLTPAQQTQFKASIKQSLGTDIQ
jgi:hypothetical protein